jgi:hypothetical protein
MSKANFTRGVLKPHKAEKPSGGHGSWNNARIEGDRGGKHLDRTGPVTYQKFEIPKSKKGK